MSQSFAVVDALLELDESERNLLKNSARPRMMSADVSTNATNSAVDQGENQEKEVDAEETSGIVAGIQDRHHAVSESESHSDNNAEEFIHEELDKNSAAMSDSDTENAENANYSKDVGNGSDEEMAENESIDEDGDDFDPNGEEQEDDEAEEAISHPHMALAQVDNVIYEKFYVKKGLYYCISCNIHVAATPPSTSNFWSHLRTKHPDIHRLTLQKRENQKLAKAAAKKSAAPKNTNRKRRSSGESAPESSLRSATPCLAATAAKHAKGSRQPTLAEAFSAGKASGEALVTKVMEFLIHDPRARLDLVESLYFNDILKMKCSYYSGPTTVDEAALMIHKRAEASKELFREKLSSLPKFSLVVTKARKESDSSENLVVGATYCDVKNNYVMCNPVLAAKELPKSFQAFEVQQMLLEVFEEYSIKVDDERIGSVVMSKDDLISDAVAEATSANTVRYYCFKESLQHLMDKATAYLLKNSIVIDCYTFYDHFCSHDGRSLLKDCSENFDSNLPLLLKVEAILRLAKSIAAEIYELSHPRMLASQDVLAAKEMIAMYNWLKGSFEAVQKMKYFHASELIHYVETFKVILATKEAKTEAAYALKLKIEDHLSSILPKTNYFFTLAALLDPRVKNSCTFVDKLKSLAYKNLESHFQKPAPDKRARPERDNNQRPDIPDFLRRVSAAPITNRRSSHGNGISSQLDVYLGDMGPDISAPIHEYWKLHSQSPLYGAAVTFMNALGCSTNPACLPEGDGTLINDLMFLRTVPSM